MVKKRKRKSKYIKKNKEGRAFVGGRKNVEEKLRHNKWIDKKG